MQPKKKPVAPVKPVAKPAAKKVTNQKAKPEEKPMKPKKGTVYYGKNKNDNSME